ncbi:MAG: hypothetical protein IJQ90_04130 [Alphaproteobacteria bacterium]|nr:hypothetical protein [Alphaproteobacteria bacterium]
MKNNNKTSNRYGYSRWQRILAWVALIGIFICGMMAGAFIWQSKTGYTADSGVQMEVDACQMREKALLANIGQNIDDSWPDAANYHRRNADIYDRLVKWGCQENAGKYQEMRDAEFQVWDALNEIRKESVDNNPCDVIERTLLSNVIYNCGDSPDCHLQNAEIYSKIVEDGCKENQQRYAQKALDELQIAEGVRIDDSNVQKGEIRATINTYKKLQMQNEAKKYLNKVEKLVNPGIDFIMELQRVIEE